MPSAQEILSQLTRIAGERVEVAVFWHAAVAAALVSLAAWRPSRRVAAAAVAAPLVSVSAFAWWVGNPFNAAVFLATALALAGFGANLPGAEARPGPRWARYAGAASLAFGLFYPHFVEGLPPVLYLFAAPVGLVPCPTLAVVLGFGLLGGGFGSRGWSFTAGGVGLFYALFGVFRLDVWLDAGLLLFAAALIAAAPPRAHRSIGTRVRVRAPAHS